MIEKAVLRKKGKREKEREYKGNNRYIYERKREEIVEKNKIDRERDRERQRENWTVDKSMWVREKWVIKREREKQRENEGVEDKDRVRERHYKERHWNEGR